MTHDEPADLAAAAGCAAAADCDPGSWSAGARGAYRITAAFQPPDRPDPNDPLATVTPPPEVRHDLVWIERRIARQ
ncbi:MAG: hypothetical protein OXG72_11390 [Acidobacteria bacterium]|nr:hypothetical protein [Acidobacteriota bacterium]